MGFGRRRLALGLAAVAVAAALAGAAVVVASHFRTSDLFDYGDKAQGGPSGGSLSPYLVGYYDDRPVATTLDVEPALYLVNPTPLRLTAYIVLFDQRGAGVGCAVRELVPNQTDEILLSTDVLKAFGAKDRHTGAVKIVTFDAASPGVTVQAGLKGWLTHYVISGDIRTFVRESVLQEVPREVLLADVSPRDGEPDELKLIVDFVNTKRCAALLRPS